MTVPPTSAAEVPDSHATPRRAIHTTSPSQLQWLGGELALWQAEGLVDPVAAAAIRGRYTASRRFTLSRIVLTLGACFVGLGLIWLVAANLLLLSPLLRVILMVVIWIGLIATAEVLAARSARAGDRSSPVVGAVRLLAAGAFGAVVFQSAQSLQLPASKTILVGVWGVGALLWAYAVRGVAPLVLGVALVAMWFVSEVERADGGTFAVSTALAAAALAGVSIGALHARVGWRTFATPWREIGAVLALVALFIAALPDSWGDAQTSATMWIGLGVALALTAAALARGDRIDRYEVGLAAVVLACTMALSLWQVDDRLMTSGNVPAGVWARGLLAVGAYLAVASGYAVLGGLRGAGRLTGLATAALVIFVTVQAFAAFAPILSGSGLFLIVGLVLIGTGILADRGRRRLVSGATVARA